VARPGVPGAGTITITDPASDAVIATAHVANGQLATIPLAPGTYTITGTFADATFNGQDGQASASVTIPGGEIIRQDVAINIP
jgi:hypothetical protein